VGLLVVGGKIVSDCFPGHFAREICGILRIRVWARGHVRFTPLSSTTDHHSGSTRRQHWALLRHSTGKSHRRNSDYWYAKHLSYMKVESTLHKAIYTLACCHHCRAVIFPQTQCARPFACHGMANELAGHWVRLNVPLAHWHIKDNSPACCHHCLLACGFLLPPRTRYPFQSNPITPGLCLRGSTEALRATTSPSPRASPCHHESFLLEGCCNLLDLPVVPLRLCTVLVFLWQERGLRCWAEASAGACLRWIWARYAAVSC